MSRADYPFVPKSTAPLVVGQFWSIPLSNGLFACGRVLQLDKSTHRRAFIGGLLDWRGEELPAFDSIAGAPVLAHGEVHIKTIAENGGEILGVRPLELDAIEIPMTLDQSPGSQCHLQQGFELLGLASSDEQERLPVFKTWGYRVIRIRAEKHFGSD